ncbi:YdcF family protein [Corynebacterium comes]|uniref:DUF218 domain-containing protein n=1 Tax=Corynebacterium comes TaxID=2675218 RepID=A0A6B8VMY5_9CORY|nr:YdcF family protein [Corynebacterium comes]QGU04479.1 hypothetical protein CETAM_06065 [Corynebacterium comes]
MHNRLIRPMLVAVAAVSLFPLAPAHAQTSALLPGSSQSLPIPGLEKVILVGIPGYGPYVISQEVQGAGLNPGAATQEDLLSAAVFSADFENNTAARDAALRALSPGRQAQVSAALNALHSPVRQPSAVPADAPIVVLGNGLNTDGTVHPNLRNRLVAAKVLADARPNAPVVVSGGATPDGFVEAEVMRDWLVGQGLPAGRIIVEGRANSTVTNARYSRELLPRAGAVVVVTSQNHVHRAVVDFTLAFGTEVAGVGAPNDPPTEMPSLIWTYRDVINWFLS